MECKFLKTLDICDNHAVDCGRPTRADLFFIQYPNAPHNDGIPFIPPCAVDDMVCAISEYNKENSLCKICMVHYWRAKVCNM